MAARETWRGRDSRVWWNLQGKFQQAERLVIEQVGGDEEKVFLVGEALVFVGRLPGFLPDAVEIAVGFFEFPAEIRPFEMALVEVRF